MEKAAFSFKRYHFDDIHLCFSKIDNPELELVFNPEGVFKEKSKTFELKLQFKAILVSTQEEIISVQCIAEFNFSDDVVTVADIPEFFYANSIAIIFPYIRSFISTLTLQANYNPLVLATMNLSSLKGTLKEHTTTSKE